MPKGFGGRFAGRGAVASASLTTLVNGAAAAQAKQGDSLTFEALAPLSQWGNGLTLVVDGVDGPTLTAADLRAGTAIIAPAFTTSLRARLGIGAEALRGQTISRAPQAPVWTTQPSFDAASYTAGATVTLSEGVATGSPSPVLEIEYFTLDGVDRKGEIVGLTWDSTGAPAGTLAAKFRATNSQGSTLSNEITASLTASATVPGRMAAPTLSAVTSNSLDATFAADPSDGGSAITSRDFRYSTDGGATWSELLSSTSPRTVGSLPPSTAIEVQARAVNSVGPGPWSASATATTAASGGVATATATFGALDADGGSPWSYRPGGTYTPLTGVTLKTGALGAYTPAISGGKLVFTGGGRGAPDGVVVNCTFAGGSVDVTISVAAASYAVRRITDLTDLRAYAEVNPAAAITPIYFRADMADSVGRTSTASLKDARAEVGVTPGITDVSGSLTLTGSFVGNFEDYLLREPLYVNGFSGKIRQCKWERLPSGADIPQAVRPLYYAGGVVELEDCDFLAPDLEPTYGSGICSQADGSDVNGYATTLVHIRRNYCVGSSGDPLKLTGGNSTQVQVVEHNYFGPPALLRGPWLGAYDSARAYSQYEYVDNTGANGASGGRYYALSNLAAGVAPPMNAGVSDANWQWVDPHGDSINVRASAGGVLVRDNFADASNVGLVGQDTIPNNSFRPRRNSSPPGPAVPMLNIIYEGNHVPRNGNPLNTAFPVDMIDPPFLDGGSTGSTDPADAMIVRTNWISAKGNKQTATRYTNLGFYVYSAIVPTNAAVIGNRDADLGERLPDVDNRSTAAPVLSNPVDAASGAAASTWGVDTTGTDGLVYWVVTTSATKPSATQLKAGQDNAGAAAAASGSQAVSASGTQTGSASGLTASTTYYTHFMHENAAAAQSAVVSASGFTTAAASGITYLGAVTLGGGPNNAITVDLTPLALQQGDLVVASYSHAGVTVRTITFPAEYTTTAGLFSNDVNDTNLRAGIKFMGATPDTSLTITSGGASSEAAVVTVQAYRGVNATTPQDVAAATVTTINTRIPNPAAVTPVTAGSLILVMAAAAHNDAALPALTAPYLSGVSNPVYSGTSYKVSALSGYVTWPGSGAYDPAALTITGDSVDDSNAAITMVLRPA